MTTMYGRSSVDGHVFVVRRFDPVRHRAIAERLEAAGTDPKRVAVAAVRRWIKRARLSMRYGIPNYWRESRKAIAGLIAGSGQQVVDRRVFATYKQNAQKFWAIQSQKERQ